MTRDSTPPEPVPVDRARQVLSWTALALIVTAVVIVIVSIVLSDEASAPTRPAGQVTTVTDNP